MQSLTEKKLILYASLFIAILLNSFKLMALREGSYASLLWHFNAGELIFEAVWNFIFCLLIATVNLFILHSLLKKYAMIAIIITVNLLLLKIFTAGGVAIQQKVFLNTIPDKQFRLGYFFRLLASHVLMAILVNIILLLRKNKQKDTENEHLRNAYLNAQLELLKEELNPHFFFNALSSLSAIVNENPKLAQQYISHLAKIFRYTLNRQESNLVSLKEELAMFDSFAALQKMRLEDNIRICIEIPDDVLNEKLPYMSLQPLLENALKHNSATREKPLFVNISAGDHCIKIENNLQPVTFKEESTATGLANLNERFMILMKKAIEVVKTDTHFTIKLPLQKA